MHDDGHAGAGEVAEREPAVASAEVQLPGEAQGEGNGDINALTELTRAANEPTLDELMRRDPGTLTEDDRKLMVKHLRMDRARWQVKRDERKLKKEENDDDSD